MAHLIAFVGDVMPGGVLNKTNRRFIKDDLLAFLQTHDLRVATLECAIGDSFAFDPEKMCRKQDIVYAETDDLKRVVELGINIVSLANNHVYDLGHDGLVNTIQQLDALGILHCGAGRNIEEASRPAVIEVGGKTFAFLGFCDYRDETVGYVPFATNEGSGVNPLYPEEYVLSEVRKYKQIYDYVYVLPHWGIEHTWFPQYNTIKMTRRLIASGADGVFSSHPHRVQPIYKYKKRYSCFSMGNFFFPDRYINKPRPTYYPPIGSDTSKYPITEGYPYVQEPTLKKWRYLGRIGLIVSLSIDSDDQFSADYNLTSLSKDNVLEKMHSNDVKHIKNVLRYIGCIITYMLPLYVFTLTARRLLGKLKRKIYSLCVKKS